MKKNEINKFLALFPESLMNISIEEQKISILLYKLLAKGKPVSLKQIADSSGQSIEAIQCVFDKWGSEVHWNEDKSIVGFFGLSLNKTTHEFKVNGITLYTWCAWDTLFIPSILNQTAEVKSHCLVTKQEIILSIAPNGISGVSPSTTVVSLVAPDTENISENVIGTFCCHIHFFASLEAGEKWIKQNPKTYISSLDDAYQLGQAKNEKRYPNIF